ncbi:MAG: hypothetical protein OXI45_07595 [Acidobacteriota bacterium]|nr:hypothetical protein [Acidobacteriota bacterium]
MPAGRLFEKPDETPPGLDAIRAWLRKPRPRLRGLWIWVRWILSGIPAAYVYAKENWPAARERIRRMAKKGEKAARTAVRVGHAARDFGGGMVRGTRALRGPDGKVTGATARVRELGRAVREVGGRLTEGGSGIAAALSSLHRLTRSPSGPSGTGLGLLDPPDEPDPETSRPPLRRAAEPGAPAPAQGGQKQRPMLPQAAPESSPDEQLERRESQAPDRQPVISPPAEDHDARFEDLPKMFIPRAQAVGERPHAESFRALILDICLHREWTTPAQLARWFGKHRRGLASRHLRPLLEAGLLERRFPDRPNTPKQAYRTRPERWPPQRARNSSP